MELRERFFDTGEMTIHYLEGPDNGPPLLLQHGATGSWTDWRSVLPYLTDRWHVYAANLRWHGLSGRPADLSGYHITHHIADMVAFLREAVTAPAVVIGHSYGAITALLAAGEVGDGMRALVLEDPPLHLGRARTQQDGAPNYFAWLAEMRRANPTYADVRRALAEADPDASEAALNRRAETVTWLDPNFPLAISRGDTYETMQGVDYGERIRAIPCPVLLMQANPAQGGALFDEDVDFFMRSAPNARLERFPDSGHGIHDDKRAEFLQSVEAFLAGIGIENR